MSASLRRTANDALCTVYFILDRIALFIVLIVDLYQKLGRLPGELRNVARRERSETREISSYRYWFTL